MKTRTLPFSLRLFRWCFVLLCVTVSIGCGGGGGPTFDGSSEEAAETSMAAMFPEYFSDDADDSFADEDLPPAMETYVCTLMGSAFAGAFSDDPNVAISDALSRLDGMTAADMEAYGAENDLIGCMQELEENLQEFGDLFEE